MESSPIKGIKKNNMRQRTSSLKGLIKGSPARLMGGTGIFAANSRLAGGITSQGQAGSTRPGFETEAPVATGDPGVNSLAQARQASSTWNKYI